MSKQFCKIIIEDIKNTGCTDTEVEALTNVFVYTTKNIATTLARKASFELKDYATTKKRGIDGFCLTIERRTIHAQQQWWGTFQDGEKVLKIIATLEDD